MRISIEMAAVLALLSIEKAVISIEIRSKSREFCVKKDGFRFKMMDFSTALRIFGPRTF